MSNVEKKLDKVRNALTNFRKKASSLRQLRSSIKRRTAERVDLHKAEELSKLIKEGKF